MTIPPFSIPAVLAGSDEPLEFDVAIQTPSTEADDPALVADVVFHVRFISQGKELQVEVEDLTTRVSTECSRCGKACEMPIVLQHVTAFVPTDGFDEDYPVRIDRKKAEVDLSDWIRVEILAAMDLFPLCQSECEGRCPTCGYDLNTGVCDCPPEVVDKPFEALKEYIKK